ncbi:MAG: phosphatidylserine decarboxylase family protein [Thermodesulfobacteriota bacterium]
MLGNRVKIAHEGLPYIGFAGFFAWLAALLGFTLLSLVLGLLTFFIAFFFRDPERVAPTGDRSVVSSGDGTVVEVDKALEPHFLNREMSKVGVFLSMLDCHVNRFPISGKIITTKHIEGKFFAANLKRASIENERVATLIETERGEQVVVVQIAGFLARRVVSYKNVGDEVEKGERIGMIKFGSRVDVYLPLEFDLAVNKGEKVTSGETIIAWINDVSAKKAPAGEG